MSQGQKNVRDAEHPRIDAQQVSRRKATLARASSAKNETGRYCDNNDFFYDTSVAEAASNRYAKPRDKKGI